MKTKKIINDLSKSAGEELKAAHDYRERAVYARSYGDEVSAKLLEHIADEEDVHYREFMERITKIQSEGEKEIDEELREGRKKRKKKRIIKKTHHHNSRRVAVVR